MSSNKESSFCHTVRKHQTVCFIINERPSHFVNEVISRNVIPNGRTIEVHWIQPVHICVGQDGNGTPCRFEPSNDIWSIRYWRLWSYLSGVGVVIHISAQQAFKVFRWICILATQNHKSRSPGDDYSGIEMTLRVEAQTSEWWNSPKRCTVLEYHTVAKQQNEQRTVHCKSFCAADRMGNCFQQRAIGRVEVA